jgi:hypothetical protein
VGYLDDKLPQRKDQIVECPKLYTLVLRVRHRDPFHAMIAAETEDTIGKIIRLVVPDPEDWQFGAGRLPGAVPKGFTEFRFHNPSHRSRAQEELRFNGYHTEIVDQ